MLRHSVQLISLVWLLQATLVQGFLGNPCNEDVDCQNDIDNSECSINSTCVCQIGYYDTSGVDVDGGDCSIQLDLGETCTQPNACVDSNSECIDTVCACETGYYDTDGSDVLGGLCIARKRASESCVETAECTSNALCTENICECDAGFYGTDPLEDGVCLPKKLLGDTCDETYSSCLTVGAICSTFVEGDVYLDTEPVCQCTTDYVYDSGTSTGGECVTNSNLGGECLDIDQCSADNSFCSNGICLCSLGYAADINNARCEPVDCGATFPTLQNGEYILVDFSNTTYGAFANVTCNAGFESKISQLECLATGEWSTYAKCTAIDCGSTLPSLPNGEYNLVNSENTAYGALANVTCNAGFESEVSQSQCLATGEWSTDATCTAIDCGELPTIPNGEHVLVDMNNASYGAIANLTCDMGYTANTSTIACLATGIWGGSECSINDCGTTLPDIANGMYTLSNADITTYLASADVICNDGYSSTAEVIACQASGKWNESTCVINECGELPTIPNGEHILVDVNNASYGAMANLTCDMGYTANTSNIACLATGIWGGSECSINDCGATLPDIANGMYTLTNADITTYLASADVICNDGYSSTAEVIACQASGKWNESTCVINECGKLPTIPNGEHKLVDVNNASYGAMANLTCDMGYTANTSTIACLATGIWGGSECSINDCGATLPDIANGMYTLSNADITTYLASADVICNDGYSSTAEVIACQASGKWNESTCVINECGELPTIPNGEHILVDVNNASYGAMANLTCDMGYTANTSTIACLATGIWGGSECSINDCGATLPDIANGMYTLSNADITTYLASADVICNDGYSSTTDVIVCQASGQWNESTCVINECGELPTIPNGEHILVDMNNASYGAMANLTCDMGYTANTSTIACLATGIWGGSECSINDCGATLPDIANGMYTLSNADITTYLASADVICNDGYSSSTYVIACQASGQWNESTCLVNDCGTLDSPANGNVDVSQGTTLADQATYTCNAGFDLLGEELRQCIVADNTVDVTWSGEVVTCVAKDCGTLDSPANGNVDVSQGTTLGDQAAHTCNAGFDLLGEELRQCIVVDNTVDVTWSGEAVTCVAKDCGTLDSPANGNVDVSQGTILGEQAAYTCNAGFDLLGEELRQCIVADNTVDVTWSGEDVTCVAKDCGTLDSPANGNVDVSQGTTLGEQAIHTCNAGFDLLGEELRQCIVADNTVDVTWSGEAVTCVEKDCEDPQIASSVLNNTAKIYGTVLQVACDAGFVIQGPSVIKCQADATWTTKPTCDAKNCGTLDSPANGNVDISQGTTLGEQATYTCNAGFDLLGEELRQCIVADNTVDVIWSGEDVTCVAKDCGTLDNPANGNVDVSQGTTLGEQATYTCNAGFDLLGEELRQCSVADNTVDVTWSGDAVTCVEKDCEDPQIASSVLNNTAKLYGTVLQVACDAGFVIQGPSVIKCQADATWTTKPTCDAKNCGTLDSPANGNVDVSPGTTLGDQATYTCNAGFDLLGEELRQCIVADNTDDVTWSGEVVTCVAKDCGTLDNPANGNVDVNQGTTLGEQATYTCNAGFDLLGEELRQCIVADNTVDVTWSGDDVACVAKDCADPQIASSVLNDTATIYGTVLQVTCADGYVIQGTSVITCQTDATWTTKPTCDANDCGTIKAPDNGGVNTNVNTQFGSTITYTCNDGYVLLGDSIRECLATGQWSRLQPTCLQKDVPITVCVKDTDSRGNVWNDALVEQTRVLKCVEGLDGNVTRFCKTDAQWELPKYNCTREAVQDIEEQISNLNTASTEAVKKVLGNISNLSVPLDQTADEANRLTDAELESITKALDTVAKALVESDSLGVHEVADDFLQTASNLLDQSNTERWQALMESDTGRGAETLMSAVDLFGEALRSQLENNVTKADKIIVKENLVMEVKRVQDIVIFPDENTFDYEDQDAPWILASQSNIRLPLPALANDASYVVTTVIYRNMSDILPTSTEPNTPSGEDNVDEINGPIIALTISPAITTKLDPPVKITFTHYLEDYTDPECRFWQAGSGGRNGYWSDQGCRLNAVESDVNKTVCECDHLTNFCVLMSPFKVDAESQALRVISIVGISISLVCLLLTIVLHMCLWKNVRSDRATLLMNLCVALCFAYVVFLAGVDRTESKTFCTIIAALLQYLYLAVFCLMLGEGIELVFTVLFVFATKSRLRKILIMAWVTPAIIVGISLGVTGGDGYGNDQFCWLSINDGLIWSFVGPVLAIILFNIFCLLVVFRSMFKMQAMATKTVKEKVSTGLRSLVILLPLMGVSWIFGIFYINDDLSFMQYIFAILNGLQGSFIFVMHCILNKRIRNALKLRKRRRSVLKETFISISHSTSKGDRKGSYAHDGRKSSTDSVNSGDGNSGYNGDRRDSVFDKQLEERNGSFDAPPLAGGRRGGLLGAHPTVAFNTHLTDAWKHGQTDSDKKYLRTGSEKCSDSHSSGYSGSEHV